MPRLIDADKLKGHYAWWEGGSQEMTLDRAKQIFDTIIDIQPTVDAEPVVRCKDCTRYVPFKDVDGVCLAHNKGVLIIMSQNGYCNLGERREDAETN